MAISINPVLPVLAAQEAGGVAPDLVLQPGSVVNAQVLKVLSADLVRIAIASLSIDVALRNPAAGRADAAARGIADAGWHPPRRGRAGGGCRRLVRRRGHAIVRSAGRHGSRSADHHCAAPERVDAARARDRRRRRRKRAATEQESLAPLFANLGAVAATGNLPPKLQAGDRAGAGATDQPRSKSRWRRHQDRVPEIRLFLEASLASGAAPSSAVPDLKAALIVLRQAAAIAR